MSSLATFKQSFKGDIVTPDDADYAEAIARWASNAERRARIVAFVKDTDDVALALKYARNNDLQIAIRGGGHSPSGSSSAEEGLVIDLSRHLNYAVVDPEKRTVRVGGGTLWGTVEKEAIQHGLASVAGSVNHTGVSGLLLGGGFGFLTGQHGLVVDNLLQATIVTANGKALTVSEEENADLFWGIRGGGSNFGVCTEFVLRLHPQRRTVFGGIVIFPGNVLDDLVTVLRQWWVTIKDNEGILQILGRDPAGNDCIMLSLFYDGSEEEGRKNFQKIYDLKPAFDGAHEIPFESLNTFANEMFAHGSNYYMKSVLQSGGPQADITKNVFKKLSELNAAPGNEIEHFYLFEYVSHRVTLTVPESATAFARTHRGMTGAAIKWAKGTPSNDEAAAKRAARELTNIVAEAEAQVSREAITGYGNFNSEPQAKKTVNGVQLIDDTNSRVLFGANYSRLQRLKAEYDPENVFSKWFAIVPNPDA
ncbi:FAD-binding domain-containing protein [Russula dissimulans]|nr:FAD-binding domain-containing protein [Russula dissimulans]